MYLIDKTESLFIADFRGLQIEGFAISTPLWCLLAIAIESKVYIQPLFGHNKHKNET